MSDRAELLAGRAARVITPVESLLESLLGIPLESIIGIPLSHNVSRDLTQSSTDFDGHI